MRECLSRGPDSIALQSDLDEAQLDSHEICARNILFHRNVSDCIYIK